MVFPLGPTAPAAPAAWLCKGFEAVPAGADPASFGLLAHEIQAQTAPNLIAGVFSGPSFAQEVALGQPTALVAASPHAQVRDALVNAFHSPSVRVYANEDIVGVEVGGAVKNVLAIATGLCDGLALGLNARAALITRGLAEMARLGVALGADPLTFQGLAGVGDLVATCQSPLSRNRTFGENIGSGLTVQETIDITRQTCEAYKSCTPILELARQHGVDMPITEQVVNVLHHGHSPTVMAAAFMARDTKAESDLS